MGTKWDLFMGLRSAAPVAMPPLHEVAAVQAVERAPEAVRPLPANRLYVFAKTCTNTHGKFDKGDRARGAFSPELVESYLQAGILVPAKENHGD